MLDAVSKPRVFISHSGTGGKVGELIAALVEGLRLEYEPMVDDRNIPLGQEFRAPIDYMIRGCDAAIVIVSQAALQSPWVKDEAALLGFKARDPDRYFALVPVYIEGTAPEDVRNRRWDPTFLAEMNPAGGDDVQAVAADVVTRLAPVRDYFTASGIERDLAKLLRKLHPETLREVVVPLFEDRADMSIAGDLALDAARRMLCAEVRVIRAVLDELLVADGQRAEELLDIVLPFTWVDRDAAALVRAAVLATRSVWLNTGDLRTARAYVSCASPRLPFWQVLDVEEVVNPEDVTDLVAAFRAKVAHAAGELDRAARLGAPVPASVLAVPCSITDTEIRDAFQTDEFSGFPKLFMAGEVSWSGVPAALLDMLELVRPELEREREKAGWATIDDLIGHLEDMRKRIPGRH